MQDDSASATPPQSGIERRLATIMMADVFGYSRMMGENEERTFATLRGHREIFDELLKLHRGRVFNTAGDAILAEFPSAVEAVRCATELQAALRTRNDHLPPDQRMLFRIGINLGDVIVQGGDLLGDGVNVAARIQTVAEPGGICISGSVYDQIQNKLSLQFQQLREQNFKNISQPIRTFSITDAEAGPPRLSAMRHVTKPRLTAGALAIVALLAAAGGYLWYQERESKLADQARIADGQRKAEQDRVIAEAGQHEAKLQAELQAARDALQQAEASRRKSEQERVAAEHAQREARLQGELKAAKEAVLRAEQAEKKADLESKSAIAALRSAEKAARPGAALDARSAAGASPKSSATPQATPSSQPARPQVALSPQPSTTPQITASPQAPSARQVDSPQHATVPPKAELAGAGGESARFDGNYKGRLCNTDERKDGNPFCWNATMSVQQGRVFATWPSRYSENAVYVKGTIAPDGSVNLTIDGYRPDGQPNRATVVGGWSSDKLTLSGSWRSGGGVSGNLTRLR
jgi:class 3 adenylate cyclase